MPNSSRRHGKALLGAAAAALLVAPAALAAPPKIYYHYFVPDNPRTSTETKFYAFGADPDDKPLQKAWDFSGGSTFSLTSDEFVKHTFSSDGVHWLSLRLQDADGETADVRYPMATHPDNWAPAVTLDEIGINELRTFAANGDFGSRLRAYVVDDSPEAGITYSWDLDNDGTFGDGEAVDGYPNEIRANNFTEARTYPIKVKVSDGQGESTVVGAIARAHSANEGPWLYEYFKGQFDDLTFTQNGTSGRTISAMWSDDFTPTSGLSWTWKLDGAPLDGASGPAVAVPQGLSLGEHTLTVIASDDGTGAGGVIGTPATTTRDFKFTIVESIPEHATEIYVGSALLGHDPVAAPTFRTLENIYLYLPASSSAVIAWDLDNDGAFDDSSLRETFFSAPNKGTYKVRAQVGSDVYEKTVVIDKGQDYAPASNTNTGGNNTGGGNTGGGTPTTPVQTPEQAKAAMLTFLSTETAEFLQLVAGANKKGIDARKAILVLGTLGPDQLPNGGTGRFDVYDKAPKLATAAAAKKPKLLGTTKVTLAKGQAKKVQVKLNKKGKALLKKKGKVKLTVKATLTDAVTGAQVAQVKSYTFKVKKK